MVAANCIFQQQCGQFRYNTFDSYTRGKRLQVCCMKLAVCPQDMHLKDYGVARTTLQRTKCLPAATKYAESVHSRLHMQPVTSYQNCLMLWINDCLLAVSDVEGTSAISIAPLTIPGCLVGGSMQHPQLHSSLQQLPYHISILPCSMVLLSCCSTSAW